MKNKSILVSIVVVACIALGVYLTQTNFLARFTSSQTSSTSRSSITRKDAQNTLEQLKSLPLVNDEVFDEDTLSNSALGLGGTR